MEWDDIRGVALGFAATGPAQCSIKQIKAPIGFLGVDLDSYFSQKGSPLSSPRLKARATTMKDYISHQALKRVPY